MKEGRVLIVDDEPMVRETLGQVLVDEGYVVDLATDGRSALERVNATRPDAILLDLMMPGMNGRQFLEALRDQPRFATVPVLIMTAVHGLEVNLAALGASELVEKPFNVEDLLNKVALAVYRSRDQVTDELAYRSQPVRIAHQTAAYVHPTSPTVEPERDIVLIIERDRSRLQALDVVMSSHGYTVVSMTRALVELSRLARALKPRAILVDVHADDVGEVLAEIRAGQMVDLAVLVFARDDTHTAGDLAVLANASDGDLLAFVERAPSTDR